MKTTINIIRVLVGILFIFSGLVKAIDPLGLSYKMQEFFELWKMSQFNDYTLWLSILIIAFEIIAGVALLLGWRMKLFSWLLLLLIIFFTFLTGYAYLSGKFKNCGCFGDCIPITSYTSFVKDIILLVLIIVLFAFKNKIKPLLVEGLSILVMLLVTMGSFWLQFYVLKHLPVIDCLPYKVGNNISEKRKIPAGALSDSFSIRFIYEKAGKEYEFSPSELPADLGTYTYKNRIDKLIRKGNAEPPIKGFSLSGITEIDSTDIILEMPYSILLFDHASTNKKNDWENKFQEIRIEAVKKNIPVYIVTISVEEYINNTKTDLPVFKCDFTAIRTAARANPTIYLLKKGTVEGKWGYADFDKAKTGIEKISNQQPTTSNPLSQ